MPSPSATRLATARSGIQSPGDLRQGPYALGMQELDPPPRYLGMQLRFQPAKEPRRIERVPNWLRPIVADVLHDLEDPSPIGLRLGYTGDTEVETFASLLVFAPGERGYYGFGIDMQSERATLLVDIAFGIQEHLSELQRCWGEPRPRCPGHGHPLDARLLGARACWVCPQTGAAVAKIGNRATGKFSS
jgi:hypothetical protein